MGFHDVIKIILSHDFARPRSKFCFKENLYILSLGGGLRALSVFIKYLNETETLKTCSLAPSSLGKRGDDPSDLNIKKCMHTNRPEARTNFIRKAVKGAAASSKLERGRSAD